MFTNLLADDPQGLDRFAKRAVEIITRILLDSMLDFTNSSPEIPTSPVKNAPSSSGSHRVTTSRPRSNTALKLNLVTALWTAIRRCPGLRQLQAITAPILIEMLIKQQTTLIGGNDTQEDAREYWTRLCADVLIVCDSNVLRSFWTGKAGDVDWSAWNWTPNEKSFTWQLFVTEWTKETDVCWDHFSQLLVVPFM